MRIALAFSCFFRLLFGKKLPAAAAAYLPDDAKALPPGDAVAKPVDKPKVAAKPAEKVEKPAEKVVEKIVEKPRKSDAVAQREGALALLGLLQREGRLVDFLRESLDGHGDADIGAAARDVHRGCKKALDQVFALEPVMPGAEDDKVTVPRGFDPAEVRLIGEAKGEPPFAGTMRHHGWRATSANLPTLADGVDRAVIAPAEVEV